MSYLTIAPTIIVTRPIGQAQQLIEQLQTALSATPNAIAQQTKVLALPLLKIIPKTDFQLQVDIPSAISQADLAIFVSPNAIECGMRLLSAPWHELAPMQLRVGVMGESSKKSLLQHGVDAQMILLPRNPQQWDSEGLWQTLQAEQKKHDWDWTERRVIIFKGDGGREWLADTLLAAGAQLETFAVYSRVPLEKSNPLWQAIQANPSDKKLWLLTSSEAVRYLGQSDKDQVALNLQLASALCPHQNIATLASEIGFGDVRLCESGDAALIKASLQWVEELTVDPVKTIR